MSAPDSRKSRLRTRRDGWTAERQLRFLDALAGTRSVSRAAAAAGMSRESAYRLRDRRDGALFAALWDRILRPDFGPRAEVDIGSFSTGGLMRLLGTHFRRERGDFGRIGSPSAGARVR